jgi:hypothetical protein
MQVRMKIGPKAGQVVDLVYHAARTLVEAGQAEDVHDQMRLPKAEVTRIDAVSVEAEKAAEPAFVGVDLSSKVEPIAFAAHGNKKKRK